MVVWHLKSLIVMRMVVQRLLYIFLIVIRMIMRHQMCYEDGNPTSPLVLKSLREDMMLEERAACTYLDQSLAICNTTACATINPVSHEVNVDIRAIGGDTDKEHADKESLSLIPTSPQTPTSSDGETFNQLASKARDSLEKKKTGSPGSSKKNKKSGSSRG